jgi:hypothetical protein
MPFDIPNISTMRITSMNDKTKLWNQQRKWYAKLKRSGFQDIEWQGGNSTHGLDSRYLKNPALRYKSRFNENTLEHYRLMQNFNEHYKFKRKMHRFVFSEYCSGTTFREILRRLYNSGFNKYLRKTPKRKKARYTAALSLFTLHHLLKDLITTAYEWNRTNPEGLLNPDAADPVNEIDELFKEECKIR